MVSSAKRGIALRSQWFDQTKSRCRCNAGGPTPCYSAHRSIRDGGHEMHRAGSLLTWMVVGLIVAYSAFVRGALEQQPSSERGAVIVKTAHIIVEPVVPPTPVVVSLPRRSDEPVAREAIAQTPKAILPPNDLVSLIREIQGELRRVGCYEGEINGIWTTSSRMATQTFTDRVNARLPIDKPDAVLLSLLQSQPSVACGKSCPSGQAIDGASRCVPSALIVNAAKSSGPVNASERPNTIVTGSISGPQVVQDRFVGDVENSGATRKVPSGRPKFWRSLVRSLDRALGLY